MTHSTKSMIGITRFRVRKTNQDWVVEQDERWKLATTTIPPDL